MTPPQKVHVTSIQTPVTAQPAPHPQPETVTPEKSQMYILHLSDLHFGNTQDAKNWHSQLADDLRQLLSQLQQGQPPRLDVLIISGDVANKSEPSEYEAAELFVNRLLPDFGLRQNQIVIVPGNHDLN
ncbi:MAG: metallophosphoesterase [Xenococcaceae cyanobacterium]